MAGDKVNLTAMQQINNGYGGQFPAPKTATAATQGTLGVIKMRISGIIWLFSLVLLSCTKKPDSIIGDFISESKENNYHQKVFLSASKDFLILFPYITKESKYTLKDDTLSIYLVDDIFNCKPISSNNIIRFKTKIINESLTLIPLDSIDENSNDGLYKTINLTKAKLKTETYHSFEFASTECYGTCPSFYFNIDTNGIGYYYGISNNCKNGKFKINTKNIERIHLLIQMATKKIKDPSPKISVCDNQIYFLSIKNNNGITRRKILVPDAEPFEINVLINYILENYNNLSFSELDSLNKNIIEKKCLELDSFLIPPKIDLETLMKFNPPKIN